jgi:hypothetical protein
LLNTNDKTVRLVNDFDRVSDCELSLADRNWLIRNIEKLIEEVRTETKEQQATNDEQNT